jgi:UDP-N-acetylglucosamine 4,6-dehydratase/5-epimerase
MSQSEPPIAIDNARILITGGTGSFGQRMVKTLLARHKPRRVVVFSRDEAKQVDMAMRYPSGPDSPMRYFIGDVRDVERLSMAMRDIDIVIHAAALKHVPIAEYNPFECIRTNVHGAENVVNAALRCGVRRVVALSTDKAANPVNLYGASKLASDKIMVAANHLAGSVGTRFSVARYGNVLGSRGSVVPLFGKLIAEGVTSLPITDPRMTRFLLTLQRGVEFVLSLLPAMRGGEIFLPKIPSVKIIQLAECMAPHLPTHIIGIRPGEKLHEVMVSEDDARTTVEFPDYYVIEPALHFWDRPSFTDIGAKPVPEGFRYASDTNSEWLDTKSIATILAQDGYFPAQASMQQLRTSGRVKGR